MYDDNQAVLHIVSNPDFKKICTNLKKFTLCLLTPIINLWYC